MTLKIEFLLHIRIACSAERCTSYKNSYSNAGGLQMADQTAFTYPDNLEWTASARYWHSSQAVHMRLYCVHVLQQKADIFEH